MKEFKVGDKVKLINRRPDYWNREGKMDHFLNSTQIISYVADNDKRVCFEKDEGWSFRPSDIAYKIEDDSFKIDW